MGFAAGLKTGSGLVQSVLDNERQARLDARATEEYEYKKKEREGVDTAVANVQFPGAVGLNTTSPVTPAPATPVAAPEGATGLPAPKLEGAAPPASVAATGATGVPPTPPMGDQIRAEGLPPPSAAPAAAPAAAAPAAAPALTGEKALAASIFQVAKAKKDVAGMNAAVEQFHKASRKELINDAAKMDDKDAYDYVHNNATKIGSMPMSIVKEGKGGYRVTAWSDDPNGPQANALLSSSDVKKLVAADKMMKMGYGAEGLELAGSVNKDLNAVIKDYNTQTNQQVTTGNTATHYANTEAETGRHNRAAEGNAAAGLQLRRDAAGAEKFQNAETFQDGDGNTYKQIFQTNKNGKIESKTFKIGGEDGQPVEIGSMPKGVKKVGGSGGSKGAGDKAIPAAGTMMEGPDGTWQSDGKGGRLSVDAPLPADRPGILKKLGLSGGEASKITWIDKGNRAGEFVTFPGATAGYNINDPADILQMQKDMSEAGVQRTAGAETASRVATAPARRAQREQQMHNLEDPNRFGPGVGLNLNVPPERKALYINTDE